MFENFFPLLGSIVTTALVGGLFGTAFAFLDAHVRAASHAPRASMRAPRVSSSPRHAALTA